MQRPRHLNVLQLLLDFGWSIDVRNDALETPLHLACFDGHVHLAELLLDRGADINAQTRDGETPLFYAARKGQYRTVRLLVRRECDLGARNCYGDVAEEEARGAKTLADDVGEYVLSQRLRERVLSFLDLKSLGYASQVSYRWHRAADNSSLWKGLGVSRWGLLLSATMGVGTVPQMAMLGSTTSNLFRLNISKTVSRHPFSCDKAILGRNMPLTAKAKERPRNREPLRPRTANVAGT
ncbi:F-box protein, putative [Phytophthora infestans T30-4]|uniref:F-box protein, putative n=1 Tax=Phytophthora infestans (strain T30-4) TaxID=403677 RepID=D0NC31_PHYIT|nr:F-box protein, putative [Phytophthora infestans T30-4]EEY55545.1 F-box protein, putative [Phytophthora infestans T30-4]|eukprot:XP_002903121.1 F-box protein, putative [Phytophthora infestans T30-4]